MTGQLVGALIGIGASAVVGAVMGWLASRWLANR